MHCISMNFVLGILAVIDLERNTHPEVVRSNSKVNKVFSYFVKLG